MKIYGLPILLTLYPLLRTVKTKSCVTVNGVTKCSDGTDTQPPQVEQLQNLMNMPFNSLKGPEGDKPNFPFNFIPNFNGNNNNNGQPPFNPFNFIPKLTDENNSQAHPAFNPFNFIPGFNGNNNNNNGQNQPFNPFNFIPKFNVNNNGQIPGKSFSFTSFGSKPFSGGSFSVNKPFSFFSGEKRFNEQPPVPNNGPPSAK